MSFALPLPLLIGAGAFMLVMGVSTSVKRWWRGRGKRFGPRALLTPNEIEFFGRLKAAAKASGLQVFPQVGMGAMLVAKGDQSPHVFSRKIVDFVVADADCQVLALIELDDSSHSAQKDAERDAMTRDAGYITLRYESKNRPSVGSLTSDLKALR